MDSFFTDDKLSQILYVIYQPVPHKERVIMYINGEKRKETIKFEAFKKWIVDSGQKHLIPSVMKSLTTYSFFLWDKKNAVAYYLQPNIRNDDFKKPLPIELKNAENKRRKKELEEKGYLEQIFDQFTMVSLETAKKIVDF